MDNTLSMVLLFLFLNFACVLPYSQTQPKITGTLPYEYFGSSTSLSGDGLTACVGALNASSSGAVWIYTRDSLQVWTNSAEIKPTNSIGQSWFGRSCSLNFDGSVVVIGGPHDNDHMGATWVYSYSGTRWKQEGKLVGSDYGVWSGCTSFLSSASGACVHQGYSVSLAAISSNIFVSGAQYDNMTGSATVFRKNSVDSTWHQLGSRLLGTDGSINAWQGQSVAVNAYGNTVAIGGIGDQPYGSVWIFTLNSAMDTFTQFGSKITPPSTSSFGSSLSLSYDSLTLAVTASLDTGGVGALFIFTRASTGFAQQGGKLIGTGYVCVANCVQQGFLMGLSANGNIAVIGGRFDSNSVGAAWVFSRYNGVWSQHGLKLSGGGSVPPSWFGDALSISADGSQALVAGRFDNNSVGAVWLFKDGSISAHSCSRPVDNEYVIFSQSDCLSVIPDTMSCTPLCRAGLVPSSFTVVTCKNGTLENSLNFCGAFQQTQPKFAGSGALSRCGTSVCISGDGQTAFIGCEVVGNVVDFSKINTGSWVQRGKIIPTDQTGSSFFGRSCSLNYDGSIAVIGGPLDSNNMGASWVFTYSGAGIWTQVGKKNIGSGVIGSDQRQGISVALASISSNVFVTGGQTANAIWIFTKESSTWTQFGTELTGPWIGYGLSINSDGTTIAAGEKINNGVWIFTRNALGNFFELQGTPLILQTIAAVRSVSLSYDGDLLVTGIPNDDGNIGGMLIYTRQNGLWSQSSSKYIGTGYSCGVNCVLQGSSLAMSANANVIALGGGYDNNGISATWIFTRTVNTSIWKQYGQKLVGSGNVGASNSPSYEHLIALSADASSLLVGGPGDNNQVGAAWAFNSTLIPVLSSCSRPINTLTTNYSASCLALIPSGTTCNPTCIPNYDAKREWIAVRCYNGTLTFSNGGACIPVPTLYHTCPDKILANVTQSILVMGTGFSSLYNISCVLISGVVVSSFPATFITTTTVSCDSIFWLNTTRNQKVQLLVAHNDVVGNQQSQNLTILGACDASKPGSIPAQGTCACPQGSFDTGSSCEQCASGEYQDETGQTYCKSCGNNQDTNGMIGSTSSQSCVCQVRYFPNPNFQTGKNNTRKCLVCVIGMSCLGNNVVVIEPGYWRANNSTADVIPCPNGAAACPGTQPNTTSLCSEGYKGPMCNVCKHGYAKVGKECVVCPDNGLNVFALLSLISLALLMCYILIRTAALAQQEPMGREEEDGTKVMSNAGVGTVFKVFLNYMQVLYYIGRLAAGWSAGSINFFAIIGQSTLSPNFISVQCAAVWTFYTRLVVIYLSPLFVVIFLVTVYSVSHLKYRKTLKQTQDDIQLAIMVILYQVHPTIMIEVFASLPCESVPGTGKSYLKADMHIDCGAKSYKAYRVVSILYLTFYVLGLVFLLVYRGLYHNAKSGKLFNPSTSAYRKYAFFFVGYVKSCYYWEAVVMARKLIIAGLSADANPGIQLVWGGAVIGASFVVTIILKPFQSSFINKLELASLLALYLAVIIGFHSLLSGGGGSWSLALLIIVNGTTAIALFGCCLVIIRQRIVQLSKFLPKRFQITDDVLQAIKVKIRMASFRHARTDNGSSVLQPLQDAAF